MARIKFNIKTVTCPHNKTINACDICSTKLVTTTKTQPKEEEIKKAAQKLLDKMNEEHKDERDKKVLETFEKRLLKAENGIKKLDDEMFVFLLYVPKLIKAHDESNTKQFHEALEQLRQAVENHGKN